MKTYFKIQNPFLEEDKVTPRQCNVLPLVLSVSSQYDGSVLEILKVNSKHYIKENSAASSLQKEGLLS